MAKTDQVCIILFNKSSEKTFLQTVEMLPFFEPIWFIKIILERNFINLISQLWFYRTIQFCNRGNQLYRIRFDNFFRNNIKIKIHLFFFHFIIDWPLFTYLNQVMMLTISFL